MAKRKIGYFYLEFEQGEGHYEIQDVFVTVMSYCMSREKNDRLHNLPNQKFCFLNEFTESNEHPDLYKIVFKSAKHSYRAPLLDKNTANERENPKTLEEGELYKTHLVIDFHDNEEFGVVYIENAQNLLSMQQVVMYLNAFLFKYNDETDEDSKINGLFKQSYMARSDFREALDEMCRVSVATLTVDKAIVGSNALNYSNQIEEAQEDIQLTIKAKRSVSIKNLIYGALNRLNSGDMPIKRMRIHGKLDNDNDCIIDTDKFAKKEYVEVQQNADTGEYDTRHMFLQLINLVYGD